ncbi:NAD-dependent epimerase/dehydratase family protein [Paenibacillus solisilvae]|uniref:NAD-dependent epimerase/dehydratase family protein n=1 Tax=Paenibacillus solisilvae TaxID=2486751 RepID=A0ABW0W5W6_9BACL
MKAVVTGGAGFIGSRLSAALHKEGHEVIVIDDLSSGSPKDLPNGLRLVKMNICDTALPAILADEHPDIVYHLASQGEMSRTILDPIADLTTNIVGTLRVLEGCRQASSCKIVLASTAAVFGEVKPFRVSEDTPVCPVSPYGLSKRAAERYTSWYYQLYGVPFTILRFANVYGPGQKPKGEVGVIAVFMERLKLGQPLPIHGNGEQHRDFVHVDDAVQACLASKGRGDNEIVHIGTGVSHSIAMIAEVLTDLHDAPIEICYTEVREDDPWSSAFIPDKASNVLGWTPRIPFLEGLRSTYEEQFGSRPPVNDRDEDQEQP